MTRVLVDTGPLVAYLNQNDRHHAWAVKCWSSLHDPMWTCEPVLTEAVFLMQSNGGSAEPVLRLVERGIVKVEFDCADEWPDVCRLIRKYRNRPMSLADASLVRMAELTDQSQVFTTDRDFLVYRRRGRHVIPLLAPF